MKNYRKLIAALAGLGALFARNHGIDLDSPIAAALIDLAIIAIDAYFVHKLPNTPPSTFGPRP